MSQVYIDFMRAACYPVEEIMIMKKEKNLISAYMSTIGKKGAKNLKEKKGKGYFSELAKKRWAKPEDKS